MKSDFEICSIFVTIFQDMKCNLQNYGIFEQQLFVDFIRSFFLQVFNSLDLLQYNIQAQKVNSSEALTNYNVFLKSLNLLIFHMSMQVYKEVLEAYLEKVLLKIIVGIVNSLDFEIVITAFDGICEMIDTKQYLFKDQLISLLVNYQLPSLEVTRKQHSNLG